MKTKVLNAIFKEKLYMDYIYTDTWSLHFIIIVSVKSYIMIRQLFSKANCPNPIIFALLLLIYKY